MVPTREEIVTGSYRAISRDLDNGATVSATREEGDGDDETDT